MHYHCLIFFDPKVAFNGSPEADQVLAEIPAYSARLKAEGHHVADLPLNLPATAVTLRNRDGKVSTTDGPFMETKEMLGGLMVIEARDLNEAIRVAGECPYARLGTIEIRPAIDFSQPRPRL
ncbi:MAG: YciI family protein [Pseudomonadota bacterium]|jgi:hypothetical protein